jgi:hypothetical protein
LQYIVISSVAIGLDHLATLLKGIIDQMSTEECFQESAFAASDAIATAALQDSLAQIFTKEHFEESAFTDVRY